MITRPRVALTLLAALFALALPAAASAAVYEVNTTADEAKKTECEAHAAGCTLRGAIEAANGTAAVTDEIKFAANPFNGENGDTISAATAMPTITDQVSIRGGRCDTAAGIKGPCAGVIKAGGGALFVVEDDDVEIQGLALSGAQTAINVISASERFVAKGNWIGFDITGSPSSNGMGIFIDPDSDAPTIGGTAEADRNVIGSSTQVGLDLEGASFASIKGNYFGVTPDGATQAANPKDIEITDSTSGGGFKAVSNEIGQTVDGSAEATGACDGGCNVISGASIGIDLEGNGAGQNEAPATGSTFIKGNFVGLSAAGTDVIANSLYGIYVGGSDHATIGGFSLAEANYVAGGGEGIASGSGGEDFVVRGNRIGFASGGGKVTPPSTAGILALALGVDEAPSIESNLIRMVGGTGIESRFETGHITGNEIEGGSIGIWTKVGEGAGLIAGNTVEAATENGILIESPENEIRANEVIGSGLSGIRVKNPKGVAMTGNLVGGSTAEKENVIKGSGGPAIEIFEEAEEAGSWTEITRNNGSGNGGLFIDLKAGANEAIVAPAISAATKPNAEGAGAEPGAKIRVFRKAGAAVGELQSFLAEATADGSGNWKVTYSVPGGTIIAATQTKETGATSELSTATVPADPSGGGGGCNDALPPAQCAAPAGPTSAPPPPPVVPDTKITKAPKAKSSATTAKFKFTSTVAGSGFECKLDKGKFKKCRSPKTYKKLKPGKHVFKVRAVGPTGLVDATPAKRKFTVLS
ncbi:MAG TPA: right-handed parallel beta-helix repeat-containing protein [Solirubrobacterales bacterium]